jgi:cell wall-associated NlpC family hydrolase
MVAALLAALLTAGTVAISVAAPTQQDLTNAQAQLDKLNVRLSLLVEQYDQGQIALEKSQRRLDDAKKRAAEATADASRAKALLSARAAQAYEGAGSGIDLLLGSSSFADFSDRLEFLNRMAQQDVDAATQAKIAGERAHRAGVELSSAIDQQQAALKLLDSRKSEIQSGIAQQKDLIAELKTSLAEQAAREAAAREAAARAAAAKATQDTSGDPAPTGGSGGGTPSPPPPAPPVGSGAAAAVAAAYSVIGVPYVWGGSSPSTGFDCSGLTMWAWAQGGVSLPHSSASQYSVLPHVSSSALAPGDLLFFYSPIHHVAIYVGNGMMIHATHPGSTVSLEAISSYWWDIFVGAGRPG